MIIGLDSLPCLMPETLCFVSWWQVKQLFPKITKITFSIKFHLELQ